MDHANHVRLRPAELTPDTLEGATIYGPNDEKIGSVDHMHGSGKVVIDVGGFLGIGAKPVAVAANELDFMRDEDGDVHAVTSWTKDQLKAMPEHRD
ncbi:PRC-barrel domain containing protein [Mesorhizobium sp. Cs1299R1N1]|uniref:PRC-barrel domain containing protein n=1 Tax=Mesorhizobium sp. Cs1299R1N1 TaxID=3015172 RepID=UPI00301C175A